MPVTKVLPTIIVETAYSMPTPCVQIFTVYITRNMHSSWCNSLQSIWSCVVFHPKNIGRNEMTIGAVQATAIIHAATLTVM